MRPMPNTSIEPLRRVELELDQFGEVGTGTGNGIFMVVRLGALLRIIASDGKDDGFGGWEHVSVSLGNRCPTWDEMQYVKTLFWDDTETVVQFHPKKSDYVNVHPYCLHLWKKRGADAELPPMILVGRK